MPRIHDDSFVEFVNTGKTQRNGSLTMKGNEVKSYSTVIAKVDRVRKVVDFNTDHYSVTTDRHQSAVTRGMNKLDGWVLRLGMI